MIAAAFPLAAGEARGIRERIGRNVYQGPCRGVGRDGFGWNLHGGSGLADFIGNGIGLAVLWLRLIGLFKHERKVHRSNRRVSEEYGEELVEQSAPISGSSANSATDHETDEYCDKPDVVPGCAEDHVVDHRADRGGDRPENQGLDQPGKRRATA